ncbi:MAG: helix-turn-helix domain-containing protein [Gemmatimonadetes bacterium]|nr:helix-turn-helix domain-containing protein [Gemmatimonadota bacterium]
MIASTGSSIEVGRRLAQVRERAGLKQAELAKSVTWSPAVLSRVESGERPVAADELDALLSAIGTPDAEHLRVALGREWRELPRPSLDHPDQDALWECELLIRELSARRDHPEVRNAFARRLSALETEIREVSSLLAKREYQVAFVGSIGIGKSTAICRMTGLEIPDPDGGPAAPVLEAGAGGITICEVHLRSGPSHGLLIEPRSEDEIRNDVLDFAEYLKAGAESESEAGDRSEGEQQGISKEIERAVRNMAGLRVRREKTPDGKTLRRDEARELAGSVGNVRELVVQILARMELHRRDRRDVWYDPASGRSPLVWLKETFEQINNGRHPEFTLPRRIEVIVPQPLLGLEDMAVRLVDTKGIDRTAARADLESLLDDPHTIAVLCSPFNSAPSAEAQLLLQRARDAGVRALKTRAALIVLPRTNEAMAVKDETGSRVDTVEEGYELKGEQVAMALQPLRLSDLAVEFFNAYQDAPERLRTFLIERLSASRDELRRQLGAITGNAHSILANQEREQAHAVIRQAASLLRTWVQRHGAPERLTAHVHDALMEQLTQAYASTIRATIRREGEWPNLSYTHHLGYGARRVAALSLGSSVEKFGSLCEIMGADPSYFEAKDLLEQAGRVLETSYEELLRKLQLLGQTAFGAELRSDIAFWVECGSEWGRGPGYKGRVASRNALWFGAEERRTLEEELWSLITKEWHGALERVTALFEVDVDAEAQ